MTFLVLADAERLTMVEYFTKLRVDNDVQRHLLVVTHAILKLVAYAKYRTT